MQNSAPPSPSERDANVYQSFNSDATVVSSLAVPASEDGFKLPFKGYSRRASGQSGSSRSIQDNTHSVPVMMLGYQKVSN